MRLRPILEFLGGLGLVVGLGACAVETYGEPVGDLTPPTTATTAATPAPPSSDENGESPALRGIFLREVRREVPEARSLGDEWLVSAGQKVCDRLRSGSSFFRAVQAIYLDGVFSDAEDTGFLAGAAVPAFCPDQLQRVVEEVGPIVDEDGGY